LRSGSNALRQEEGQMMTQNYANQDNATYARKAALAEMTSPILKQTGSTGSSTFSDSPINNAQKSANLAATLM
jgi:hypothetical protein